MEKWNDIDFRYVPKSVVLGMVVRFSLFWLGIIISAFWGGVITKLGCLVPFYAYMVLLDLYLDSSSDFYTSEDGRKKGKLISSLWVISYFFFFFVVSRFLPFVLVGNQFFTYNLVLLL